MQMESDFGDPDFTALIKVLPWQITFLWRWDCVVHSVFVCHVNGINMRTLMVMHN